MTNLIQRCIQILETNGYRVIKKITPEEKAFIDKALSEFEASNQQFPDELFKPKSEK